MEMLCKFKSFAVTIIGFFFFFSTFGLKLQYVLELGKDRVNFSQIIMNTIPRQVKVFSYIIEK